MPHSTDKSYGRSVLLRGPADAFIRVVIHPIPLRRRARLPRRQCCKSTVRPRPIIGWLCCAVLGMVVFVGLSQRGGAQDAVTLGTYLGYEFGVPLAAARLPGVVNRYGVPGFGSSYNHSGSLGLVLTAPKLFGPVLSPSVRLNVAFSAGRFVSDPFVSDSLADSVLRLASRQFELFQTLSTVGVDIPVQWSISDRWWAGFGLWGSYRLTSGFILTESIVSPDSVVYASGSRQRTTEAGETLGAASVRGGALASIGLELPIGSRLYLQPDLHIRLDAASVGDLGIRAASVGLGLSVRFDPPDRQNDSQPDRPPVLPQPPVPRLAVSVSMQADAGSSSDTAVLTTERTHYRTVMPMHPVVYFDSAGTSIPARYHLLTPTDAAGFNAAQLARRTPDELYYDVLNIVALRMRADTTALLELVGSRGPDDRADRSRERVAAVRAYLTDVWRIAPGRVVVGPSAVLPADNGAERSVRMRSSSASIGAPITSEWIVQRWTAPRIALKHGIEAEAGVRSRVLVVRQGARIIARNTDADGALPDVVEGAFTLADRTADPAPLIAELTVEDGAGGLRIARDTLPFVRAISGQSSRPQREHLLYQLLGSDADILPMINDASASMNRGARVVLEALQDDGAVARIAARVLAADPVQSGHLTSFEIKGAAPVVADARNMSVPEMRWLRGGATLMIDQSADSLHASDR